MPESILELSPREFEKYALYTLARQVRGLENCRMEHDKMIITKDGSYQIDGYMEFTVMGVTCKTLVECKRTRRKVERDKVMLLYQKIMSGGAHKGIMISASGFQSGAVTFATEHGIALIELILNDREGETEYWNNYFKYHPVSHFIAPQTTVNLEPYYTGDLIAGHTDDCVQSTRLYLNNPALAEYLTAIDPELELKRQNFDQGVLAKELLKYIIETGWNNGNY